MYSFDELHPRRDFINGRSVAYWLGVLRKSLPEEFTSARKLGAAMALHYDIEEQACDEEHLRTAPDLLFDVFSPIAPVSLAEGWSPIPLACALAGSPILHDIDTKYDWGRAAFVIFESTFLTGLDDEPTSVHVSVVTSKPATCGHFGPARQLS